MVQVISKLLMDFFMGTLGLPFEAALTFTIVVWFLAIAMLVCGGAKLLRTRLCRPVRRGINNIMKEEDD
jgi:hypothetical protein